MTRKWTRILLIEDDSAVARSIELMLALEGGFNVYTTDLGEEGIDLAKLYDYDVILLDLVLSDIPSYEVVDQLRVSNIKTKTPIVVIASSVDAKVKEKLGRGVDYIIKPFHRDELVARVKANKRAA